MKKRELKELRLKEAEEIKKLINDKVAGLLKSRLKAKIGGEKNLKKVKNQRKEIAQLNTILNEKKIIETEKGGNK